MKQFLVKIISILFASVVLLITACGLLYPPGYYDQLVNKSESSGGESSKQPWTKNSVGGVYPLSGIAWGNGTYVAVDTTGKSYTSADAKTWTGPHIIVASMPYYSVTYSQVNTSFFAAGNATGSSIMQSSDGQIWSTSGSVTASLLSIKAINGYLIAVGSAGIIQSTPETPIAWVPQTFGASSHYGICFDGTTYYAIGDTGEYIATVSPVSAWTPSSIGSANFRSICYNGSIFVAVGTGGVIYAGSSLATMSSVSSPTAMILNKVVYLGPLFIAVGNGGTIVGSENGINWFLMNIGAAVDASENLVDICVGPHVVISGDKGNVYVSP